MTKNYSMYLHNFFFLLYVPYLLFSKIPFFFSFFILIVIALFSSPSLPLDGEDNEKINQNFRKIKDMRK